MARLGTQCTVFESLRFQSLARRCRPNCTLIVAYDSHSLKYGYEDDWYIILVRPFSDGFQPRFSPQRCSSLLGGVKSMQTAVLLSDTLCERSVVFD